MRVLISGAGGGIGRAIARHLGERGHEVIATGRDLAAIGDVPAVLRLPMDVCSEPSVRDALERAQPVDVIVNNAGAGLGGPTEAVPVDEAKREFEVNFFGAARVTAAALPAMRRRRSGTIVNVSSLSAGVPWPFGAFYAASKAALEAFSDAVAVEVAPFNIRVVLIEPGVVATRFGDRFATFGGDEECSAEYAPVMNEWSKRFSVEPIPPHDVAVAVCGALEAADPPRRVPVGDDAVRLLNKRRALDELSFMKEFQSYYGIQPVIVSRKVG